MARQVVEPRMVMVVLLALGCADNVGPERGDPAQYVLDPVVYACGGWSSQPTVSLGLFDVFWGLEGPGDEGTGPKLKHRAWVLDAGGTIVHEFHVPMIRAILAPRRVPELRSNMVTGVPDATVFTVNVGVGYSSGFTDGVIELFESLPIPPLFM